MLSLVRLSGRLCAIIIYNVEKFRGEIRFKRIATEFWSNWVKFWGRYLRTFDKKKKLSVNPLTREEKGSIMYKPFDRGEPRERG